MGGLKKGRLFRGSTCTLEFSEQFNFSERITSKLSVTNYHIPQIRDRPLVKKIICEYPALGW
jgi:hypothetical protein